MVESWAFATRFNFPRRRILELDAHEQEGRKLQLIQPLLRELYGFVDGADGIAKIWCLGTPC
jgi:hypothetical protein